MEEQKNRPISRFLQNAQYSGLCHDFNALDARGQLPSGSTSLKGVPLCKEARYKAGVGGLEVPG